MVIYYELRQRAKNLLTYNTVDSYKLNNHLLWCNDLFVFVAVNKCSSCRGAVRNDNIVDIKIGTTVLSPQSVFQR